MHKTRYRHDRNHRCTTASVCFQPSSRASSLAEMNRFQPPTFSLIDVPTLKERYSMDSVLGEGHFAKVYAGRRVEDSLPVALKVIEMYSGKMDPLDRSLPLEVSMLNRVSHIRSVIKLMDACYDQEENTLTIVTERKESTMDLCALLMEQDLMPQLTRSLFRQLVETVIQCQAAGVVQGDIKPENILVDVQEQSIKLIDFGCAMYTEEFIGTFRDAPEYAALDSMLGCSTAAKTSDSLALTLCAMVYGNSFYDVGSQRRQFRSGQLPEREDVPVQSQLLIQRLLTISQTGILPLEEILQHPCLEVEPAPAAHTGTCPIWSLDSTYHRLTGVNLVSQS